MKIKSFKYNTANGLVYAVNAEGRANPVVSGLGTLCYEWEVCSHVSDYGVTFSPLNKIVGEYFMANGGYIQHFRTT